MTGCGNEDNSIFSQEGNNSFVEDPTRVVFKTVEDLSTYIMALPDEEIYSDDIDLSGNNVLDNFKKITPLGKVLNERNEIQIENKIIKFGESGYTQYVLDLDKYTSGLEYIKQESIILGELSKFDRLSDCCYKLSDGIELYYNGSPIINIDTPTVPETKTVEIGDYKAQVAFWKSSAVFVFSCGALVDAFKKSGNDFKEFNTRLQLSWSRCAAYRIDKDSPTGLYIPVQDASYTGTGSRLKKTWDKITVVDPRLSYTYELSYGAIITGSIWNGNEWITAQIVNAQ